MSSTASSSRSRASGPCLALLVALCAPSPLTAQDTAGTGAIAGTVTTSAGAPASAVRVCALGSSSCATTDADGAFRIPDLRAGEYVLEIIPAEGLPITSDPVPVRAGRDGRVEITLAAPADVQQ